MSQSQAPRLQQDGVLGMHLAGILNSGHHDRGLGDASGNLLDLDKSLTPIISHLLH